MYRIFAVVLVFFLLFTVSYSSAQTEGVSQVSVNTTDNSSEYVFATFADGQEALDNIYYLVESVREFGGKLKDAPVWVYIPDDLEMPVADIRNRFTSIGAEIKIGHTPEDARWLYFSGKTYAAGDAETEAAGKAKILIWMDEDTIVLQEPAGFMLDPNTSFAYRPVMHNRSGSLYSEPPSAFWQRIYDDLKVKDADLFSMVTPADKQTVRAYFNAGLLVVRPEKGILRKWGQDFTTLWQDTVLAKACREDVEKRIFLHQTALVGAVLNTLKQPEMIELGMSYNYPLFFHQMFEAATEFESIDGIVTMRYDVYFRNPDPKWAERLKGPQDKVSWLKERLGK